MYDNLDVTIIEGLRALRASGKKPSELLKYMQRECLENEFTGINGIKYFRAAFGLSIKQVSPIPGWVNGEIPDQRLDEFLEVEMPS